MSDQYTYARFWRCALQVNPVGYNGTFRGHDHRMSEAEYNQSLLAKCKELDIKIIGLADHGSVDSVDTLRNVLNPHGIVVFPGFEIASTEKIHMVCLFPEHTTKDQLNRYLGSLKLTDSEEKVRTSKLGCIELAEIIKELGGFWYAAHATQVSGILFQKSIHTWQRSELVKAAQILGSVDDLPSEYKNIVLNTDPNWKRDRPIAVINAKDVAKPTDLDDVSATCWIKMTKPNFDAFKVAFLDPESRIRLNSQKLEETAGEVVSMTISGGYLDGVEIAFSRHLNTVIGGRGTGKSTLLECLRYVLDIPPKGRQAQKLHLEIIKENLGKASGRIELEVVSSSQHGKRYRVTRRYGEMPIVREMTSDGGGNVSTLQPRDLLPGIDLYGQNEIYELAQDERSRIQLLDRFLPNDGEYTQHDTNLKKRLLQNQHKLTKTLNEVDDLKSQIARLPKLVEQLQGFQTQGIQEKLAKTALFARERQIVQRIQEEIQQLRDGMTSLQENLPDLVFISDNVLEGLPNAALLSPARTVLDSLRQGFERHLAELTTQLENGEQQLVAQLTLWKQSIAQGESELEKALRSLPATAGKSGQEVGTAYQRLLQDIERIKPLETRIANHDKLLEFQLQERRNLLAELSDLRDQRTKSLQAVARKLNRQLDGKLKVEVVAEADRSPLKTFLLDCKLEGVDEKRLSWIDERDTISPPASMHRT